MSNSLKTVDVKRVRTKGTDNQEFNGLVLKLIQEYEEKGYVVEVQYSTAVDDHYLYNSALCIIKKNIKK